METEEIFAAVARERYAFADLIASLTPEQLATRSLCGAWSVQDVAGHISFAAKPNQREFIGQVLRQRGSFDRANDVVARRYGARPVGDIVALIRRNAEGRFHPPGPGVRAPITDILLHTTDVREPLGLPYDPPADVVKEALGFLAGAPFGFVRRGTVKGLRLVAPDVGFEDGSGELVEGSGMDLAMALTGRTAALPRLSGDGVATLRSRLTG